MSDSTKIKSEIRRAQEKSEAADAFIRQYLPFIRSETAKFLHSFPQDGQDELSIAMFAFYECLLAYEPARGAFLPLAAVAIRNRLIDYARKEQRHRNTVSLNAPDSSDEPRTLEDSLPAEESAVEQLPDQLSTKKELAEFSSQLRTFGLTLSDVADECPRQERTMSACMAVLRYAKENPELLGELVKKKKLPLLRLVEGAGVERKTIERHRKYVVAILLAYTNGYEIIRGHLQGIKRKGETEPCVI